MVITHMKPHLLAYTLSAAMLVAGGAALAADTESASVASDPARLVETVARPTPQDIQDKISTLHNVLRADPKNYDAHLNLGEIYLQMAEPAEAIKQFTAALPSSEHEARAKEGLGLAFMKLGDNASTQRYLSEALSDDDKLWRAHLGLAELADETRDWAAEKSYQAAIAASPQSAAIYNNLGLSYTRQRRYDEAIAQFQKSLSLRGSPAVRSNMRFAYAMKGDYLTALASVSRENLSDALNNVGYAAMMRRLRRSRRLSSPRRRSSASNAAQPSRSPSIGGRKMSRLVSGRSETTVIFFSLAVPACPMDRVRKT
jgi:Tfp pilus assembly protein PilF